MAALVNPLLNDQQMMMLRLFKKPLPDADFQELHQLAVKLLSKQLDKAMEDWETENGIDSDYK